jgi:hypothetical protein
MYRAVRFNPATFSAPVTAYGCGCGCNSCGGSLPEVSGYGAWLDGWPDWNWKGTWYSERCPDYVEQVKIYEDAKKKWFALSKKDRRKSVGKNLEEIAKNAEREGKASKKRCKGTEKQQKLEDKRNPMGAGGVIDPMAASLAFGSDEGEGINLGVILGVGALLTVGVVGAAFVIKKRKQKAAAAASAR